VLISGLEDGDDVPPVVLDESGATVPVSKSPDGWQFFAGRGGVYQMRQGHRERMISLTLPQPPKSFWEPSPAQLMPNIPAASGAEPPAHWWPWLTAFGLLCLLADAIFFDRRGEGDAATARPNPLSAMGSFVRQILGKEARSRHGV
jgi:hypothetical protein